MTRICVTDKTSLHVLFLTILQILGEAGLCPYVPTHRVFYGGILEITVYSESYPKWDE